jgi:hypothetical protein
VRAHLCTLSLACSVAAGSAAAAQAADESGWCPPTGPTIGHEVEADNSLLLRPGWVTLQMHVRPGAVPVTDVRVVSEAGGPGHARLWLPLVRQWTGCAANQRETLFRMRLNFGVQGAYQLPEKEGFGLYAFKSPAAPPKLAPNDWGTGICPIRATLVFRQPAAPNVVTAVEGAGGEPIADWLRALVPDRDYMVPGDEGNRVDFGCKVDKGQIVFYER